MFISHQRNEVPFPKGLAPPDVRHWRLVELALQAPWFMLTLEVADEATESERLHTLFLASELDLERALRGPSTAKITGLMCMLPGWVDSTDRWAARAVREVWLARTDRLLLVDSDGDEINYALGAGAASRSARKELLLRLED